MLSGNPNSLGAHERSNQSEVTLMATFSSDSVGVSCIRKAAALRGREPGGTKAVPTKEEVQASMIRLRS